MGANSKFKKIGNIHNVSLYGKLASNNLELLRKIEEITTKEEWSNIKGIFCTDCYVREGMAGAYLNGNNSNKGASPAKITLDFRNGEKGELELDENQLPAIVISSLKDDYSFAITLMHELGHHINGDKTGEEYLMQKREKEINADIFALTKVSRRTFKPKTEPNSYYWVEAKKEYINRFGIDDHVIGDGTFDTKRYQRLSDKDKERLKEVFC